MPVGLKEWKNDAMTNEACAKDKSALYCLRQRRKKRISQASEIRAAGR